MSPPGTRGLPPGWGPGSLPWYLLPLRLFIGGYFAARGYHKLVVPPAAWLFPRVGPALSSSPLRRAILAVVYPHAAAVGTLLGAAELLFGSSLVLGLYTAPSAMVLAVMNLLFFLTLGFHSRHEMALNLTMLFANLVLAAGDAGRPFGLDRLRRADGEERSGMLS